MPNHVHFIVLIDYLQEGGYVNPPLQVPISTVVQWFKIMTTAEYIRCVKNDNWQRFDNRLWQRNYFEHIIRADRAYMQISEYIEHNPYTWENDKMFQP